MTVSPRSTQKEMMDDVSIRDERIDAALGELAVINTWLGGHAASRAGVARLAARTNGRGAVSVLDVGAGGSDLVAALERGGVRAEVTALDINSRACEYSARAHPAMAVVRGSVLALPFRDRAFDIVHASLFLHHFTGPELRGILDALFRIARRGIVINDLRRSGAAWLGITLLTRLFSRSAMVRHDGPVSVRRGFARGELGSLCAALPRASVVITRRWAFRWLACIEKSDE